MNITSIKPGKIAFAPFTAISMALSVLLERQGLTVSHIFDNNQKLHGKHFRGIPICGASEEHLRDTTVIVCSFISLKQIAKQLHQLSAENVIPYNDIISRDDLDDMLAAFSKILLSGMLSQINEYHNNVMHGSGDLSIRAALPPVDASEDSIILPLTTLVLTERCTLRCKECSHFMQYFQNPVEYKTKDIIANFDKLLSVVSFVRCVGISGGEPLLHKNILEVIEHVCTSQKVGYVAVTTNATIMPNEEFFRSVSAHENLIMRLSDYGKHSKYIEDIVEKCKRHHIRHAILNNATWYGGLRITEVNNDFNEVRHVFRACSTKSLLLKGHSFSKCQLACFAESLGAIPGNVSGTRSCLDVSREDFNLSTLKEYFDSQTPLQACSICSGASRTREQVPPAEQTNELFEYRVYN